MPNRRTVSLLNRTRPKRSRGAGQVQSPSRYSAGYPRVSNGTPGSGCCPVRLTTYRKRPCQCVPNPCWARQAVGVRRSSSRRQRKSIPKLRPTPLHGKPRRRKRRAYAPFGWPRKQPTRILQIAARRQRRPEDLRRAGAFEDLRPQPQNPSKARLRVFQDGCGGCREAIRTARLVLCRWRTMRRSRNPVPPNTVTRRENMAQRYRTDFSYAIHILQLFRRPKQGSAWLAGGD